ncbi:MAG: DNA polymerase III subunit delta [Bryobacterales bacterium]|nr:DNA polymerase III subunit delta [Bryobacterales bacterium]
MSPRDLSLYLKKKGEAANGYLFLGAEPFYQSRCMAFLRECVLGPGETLGFFVDLNMKKCSLTDVLDEADAPLLFGGRRIIAVQNADAALQYANTRGGRQERTRLAEYFRHPTPDTVLVLQADGHAWEDRDGRSRLERAAKYYSAVPERVDFRALGEGDALYVGRVLAKRLNLKISRPLLVELVELLGIDVYRLESELQKLQLFAGPDREIDSADLALLVPEARQRGMFEFSDAIADRDRSRALDVLDTMAKAGVYWGLQVSMLAALLRQALAAKELGLRGVPQIRQGLAKFGIRVWPARAKQIDLVARRYAAEHLQRALTALFEVDRGLRQPRPDDRILMEMLVMKLTS